MTTIFNALYIDRERVEVRACTTNADAKHWLAFEAIPASDWQAWVDALARSGERGVPRERTGMSADEVIAAWTGTDAETVEPGVTTWGHGELVMSIVEQSVFERPRA